MPKTSQTLHSAVLAIVFTASMWGVAAWADDQPASPSPTAVPGVTVVAPKLVDAAAVPLPVLRDFVRSHGAPSDIGQLARWTQAVCPTTVGLPPEFNAFVSQRVRDVAARVGASTGQVGKCTANVVVIFTPEPQKIVDSFRDKAPALLGVRFPAQAKRIATVSHPIQAWYADETDGPSGATPFGGSGNSASPQTSSGDMSMGMGMGGGRGSGGGASMDFFGGGSPAGASGSRFKTMRESHFGAVIIVADANKAPDYEVGAIADYIALLALSQVNPPDACGPMPSITDLMASTCAAASRPTALTDGDVAYLKALYATGLASPLWVQQGDIAERMRHGTPDR